MGKLTTDQVNLLADLLEGPQSVVCAYKPGSALIRLGLAIGRDDDQGYSRKLTITEEGRRHPAINAMERGDAARDALDDFMQRIIARKQDAPADKPR